MLDEAIEYMKTLQMQLQVVRVAQFQSAMYVTHDILCAIPREEVDV